MSSSLRAALVGIVALALAGAAHADVLVTVGLGTPTLTPTTATLPVTLTFPGATNDTIEAIQLSVMGSHSLLTDNGTDFARFAFVPTAATIPGWFETPPGLGSGVGLYVPSDPLLGPFLVPSPTPYPLGTLTVNLAGLAPGTDLFVTLASGPLGQETDAGGMVSGNVIFSFANDGSGAARLAFSPSIVAFRTQDVVSTPEPATIALLGAGLIVLLGGARGQSRTRLRITTSHRRRDP